MHRIGNFFQEGLKAEECNMHIQTVKNAVRKKYSLSEHFIVASNFENSMEVSALISLPGSEGRSEPAD